MAVVVQGLWSQARSDRRSFAVLAALGFTRRQLAEAGAWQSLPVLLTALLVAIPLGTVVGRSTFRAFAESLDVVDVPSSPAALLAVLALGCTAAVALGALVAAVVARRIHPAGTLREG
jgi:hypothetical protein